MINYIQKIENKQEIIEKIEKSQFLTFIITFSPIDKLNSNFKVLPFRRLSGYILISIYHLVGTF